MNLDKAYQYLNFWISKYTGSFYSPEELDLIVDRGSISLFSELQPQYATSQRIKDALSPFVMPYDFTSGGTPGGLLTIPSNLNCLSVLSITISYTENSVTRYSAVPILNADEVGERLRSQIVAPTTAEPIVESRGNNIFQFWPKVGMNGTVMYLRRPAAPYFAYSVVSNRVIVYNAGSSIQLEWHENWQNAVLLKALQSIGINLTDQEILNFSQVKTTENSQNTNNT